MPLQDDSEHRNSPATRQGPSDPEVKLRLVVGSGVLIGPGRIALLEAIRECGAIAAAARRTGISYRKTRTLIDELNIAFDRPVVHSSRGGAEHGGAHLTPLGERLIARYRALEHDTAARATEQFSRHSLGLDDDD
ncbi:winged helix-turn-helix domain-containing protein [Kushneria aurantia]|uniref:Winged helix-turn-helix domain-containing protein n=1 Tax=Kushneria aurantia TaxID=504092 RepID=A0ABV6G163_9GAMM|nr:winged helix-turn-helix domain-containing protein [Kushneria aurantia]